MDKLVLNSLDLYPVWMAPMSGITDKPFRRLATEYGCGLTFTEMISAKAIEHCNRRTWGMLDVGGENQVGVQLFGSDPAVMAAAAITAWQKGAAVIDINMGCPVAKVVGNGEGAALLRKPQQAEAIVKAVSRAVSVPVTVKIRSGWDDQSINAVDFAQRMAAAGAMAVTVHGRTRQQLYSGKADWSVIARVAAALPIPVIGNGDIWSGRDAVAMMAETGCQAVMVARGALGRPWIFAEIKAAMSGEQFSPPGSCQRLDIALRHLDMELAHRAQQIAVMQMRKHLAWYIRGMHGAARLKEQLFRETNPDRVKELLRHFRENLR